MNSKDLLSSARMDMSTSSSFADSIARCCKWPALGLERAVRSSTPLLRLLCCCFQEGWRSSLCLSFRQPPNSEGNLIGGLCKSTKKEYNLLLLTVTASSFQCNFCPNFRLFFVTKFSKFFFSEAVSSLRVHSGAQLPQKFTDSLVVVTDFATFPN